MVEGISHFCKFHQGSEIPNFYNKNSNSILLRLIFFSLSDFIFFFSLKILNDWLEKQFGRNTQNLFAALSTLTVPGLCTVPSMPLRPRKAALFLLWISNSHCRRWLWRFTATNSLKVLNQAEENPFEEQQRVPPFAVPPGCVDRTWKCRGVECQMQKANAAGSVLHKLLTWKTSVPTFNSSLAEKTSAKP